VPIAVVSNDDKVDYCRKLGAKGCINRRKFTHWGMLPHWKDQLGYAEWLKGARAFGKAIWDILGEKKSPRIVFEHPGEDTIPTSLFVCDTGGMVVICAGTTGYNATVDLRYLWMRQKRLQGSHFANDEQAKALNDLVARGDVDPCLSRVFSWDELPAAHQLMFENRHPHGNMAVLVGARDIGLRTPPVAASTEPEVVYGRPKPHPEEVPSLRSPTPDRTLVREVMHAGVITCRPETPVREVARLMIQHNIRAVVVVGADGEALGVVSQTNLVLARQGRQPDALAGLAAGDIMVPEVLGCSPDTPLHEAVTTMTRNRIHRLFVLERQDGGKRKPVGVLSMTDIVRAMV
jgi:crotonyl-CoA carboxylase/reductase